MLCTSTIICFVRKQLEIFEFFTWHPDHFGWVFEWKSKKLIETILFLKFWSFWNSISSITSNMVKVSLSHVSDEGSQQKGVHVFQSKWLRFRWKVWFFLFEKLIVEANDGNRTHAYRFIRVAWQRLLLFDCWLCYTVTMPKHFSLQM